MSSSPSKSRAQLPDFIIGGAMKSATNTLHHILSQHDEVYIPDGEVHFFSVDDSTEHPAFFHELGEQWATQDFRERFDTYWTRYRRLFEGAGPDQVVGEDSTVYLAWRKAPARIAEHLPDVKLIFLLRNPVERAYSHYYHALQAGRAIYSFEDALQYGRRFYITRGLYREHLERYLRVFDRENITVLISEDFIQNMQARTDDLCEWLGLSEGLDLSSLSSTQKNASLVPRWPKLAAWQNYIFRPLQARNYDHRIAELPDDEFSEMEQLMNGLNYRLRYFNLHEGKKPPMSPEAKAFLQKLYARENRGLSDLIGIDLSQYWDYL